MTRIGEFTSHNLDEQGFGGLDDAAKFRYRWSLRFTPGMATGLIAVALALRSPVGLGTMVFVALTGALFPRGMLIDLFYNLGVRHLFRAPPLPPTPKPRQFSYWISAVFLAGSSLSFYFGRPTLGLILGGLVCVAGALLTTTLWCLGSWYFKVLFGGPVVAEEQSSRPAP